MAIRMEQVVRPGIASGTTAYSRITDTQMEPADPPGSEFAETSCIQLTDIPREQADLHGSVSVMGNYILHMGTQMGPPVPLGFPFAA